MSTDIASVGVPRELGPDDIDYPAALHDLADKPKRLWVAGTLASANAPAVAIVGTRNATPYGLRTAKAIAARCATSNVAVISGMARGIDGMSHQAALDAGGRTVGVLGTGVDVVYPKTHRALQQRVAAEGLLLSEHPNGSTGHGGAFPRRNRMIAALAQVVIVVEAGDKSGALITASHAQMLGRHVMAVPGPIDSPACVGSNRLLREAGTTPLLRPEDVLELLAIDPSPLARPILDDDAAACWDALQQGASDSASVVRVSGLAMRKVTAALGGLELEGLITIGSTGRISIAPDRVAR